MRNALPLLAALCAACGFGHDVAQDGKYLVVPSTPVTDSAPYPLATLLFVQRDAGLSQTRFYAFRGDLRRADLGIEDIRRIATRFGGFQMAFDVQATRFEADDMPKSRGNPLMAKLGGEDLSLVRLNDDGLQKTGATTWLARVNTTDYDVSAYFGVIDKADPASIAISRAGLDYDPPAADPELAFERDDEKISLEFTSKADYVVIELVQPIVDTKTAGNDEDDEDAGTEPRILDGLVRTLLSPATKYQVGAELLTDVAGKGCWSREQPIEARLHQFFRRYQQRTKGDWAVVYERIDHLEVSADDWTALLADPTPSAYCKDFAAVAQ
jgi:hypothetical protein